jgi:hypothetical protein
MNTPIPKAIIRDCPTRSERTSGEAHEIADGGERSAR